MIQRFVCYDKDTNTLMLYAEIEDGLCIVIPLKTERKYNHPSQLVFSIEDELVSMENIYKKYKEKAWVGGFLKVLQGSRI